MNALWTRVRGALAPTGVRLVVLGVLAAVAAVAAFVTHRHDADRSAAETARTEVADAVERLLSYTPTNLEASLEEELDLTTGRFRETYRDLIEETVVPAQAEQKATVVARTGGVGVVEGDRDRVRLLLFVNVSTTRGSDDPEVVASRLEVEAVRVDDRWKIAALDGI